MTWGLKRQFSYVFVIIMFFSMFAFLIIYPKFNVAPTCMDGLKNGNETGIDCGGSCEEIRACLAETEPITILWSRAFQVVPGRYNAVAYLQNHNKNKAVNELSYKFRFADANNVFIGKREGTTFIPPGGYFAIFEPAIDIGNSVPVYTTFEFTTEIPIWKKISVEKINQLKVVVSNIQLKNEDTSPMLSATVQNNSLFVITEMNVIAILYDASHNAISASRSYIDILNGGESTDLTFTWPEKFASKVISTEIIPMYNIDLNAK